MSQARTPLPFFESVAQFHDWAEGQQDRWELHDGVPVAMSPERLDHTRIKSRIWAELDRALREAGSGCEAIGDGLAVSGPGRRSFEPDATVLCGDRQGGNDKVAQRPVILVEVLSPSTADVDNGLKLDSYFALSSVLHYLIVSSTSRRVVHHRRWTGGRLLTTLFSAGSIRLDPPGISVAVDAFYQGTDLATPGA